MAYADQMEMTQEVTVAALFLKKIGMINHISFHKVENGKVKAEQLLTKDKAAAIFSQFDKYKPKHLSFKGIIPNNIVVADSTDNGNKIIFKVPSHTRTLYFDGTHGIDKKMKCSLPNLIFIYENGLLKVFSTLASNITEDTKLYHAPFMNTGSEGNVCMGNVKLNKVDSFEYYDSAVEFLSNAFFSSIFTHSNYSNVLTAEYLKKCYSLTKYTKKNLVETELTISQYL